MQSWGQTAERRRRTRRLLGRVGPGGLTELVLQHPDLQLDEAVSVEALVFAPAAVADFVAAKVQLALGVQGSDFGISNRVLLQSVNQTPKNRRDEVRTPPTFTNVTLT